MATIFVKDELRAQVEAATGGQVTVLYTAAGHPCYMSIIPKFNLQDIDASLGTGVHPAFIVNGTEKNELFIGQYQGIVKDNNLLSIPGVIPTVHQNFDYFRDKAANNGTGWHLITNAEWSAIALWTWRNSTMPRGNNNYGKSDGVPWETGRRGDKLAPGTTSGDGKVFTGSGPASWRHNGQSHGISDLNGNVWEWTSGMRLLDGEIHVLENNNAADNTKDQSSTSSEWKAILASNGSLVTPGTVGTLKYDCTAPGTTGLHGEPQLSDVVVNRNGTLGDNSVTPGYTKGFFENITVKAGVTVPAIIKTLGIYPVGGGLGADQLSVRNYGERMLLSGGSWSINSAAGVFSRYLNNPRTDIGLSIGARVAYVL